MPTSGTIPRLRGFDYTACRPYFVTFVTRYRQQLFRDPKIAGLARDVILRYRALGWYRLGCYCVMPDHVHVLVTLLGRRRSLSNVVAAIKNQITYHAKLDCRTVRWQLGYHDRIAREHELCRDYLEYVIANPVRMGLVTDFRQYPFSGIVDW
jgi:putative transposase